MTKKYIDKGEVKRKISQDLQEGKSKIQIITELEATYYEKDQLRKLVIGTLHPGSKEKFKSQNILLGIIAIVLVLFRFWAFRSNYVGSGLSILTLIMAITVFTYDAISYRLIATISIITFLRHALAYDFNSYLMIDLMMTITIVGLGFYLGSHLFPNYGLFGPRKDIMEN